MTTVCCCLCRRTIFMAASRGVRAVLRHGVIVSESRACGGSLKASCDAIAKPMRVAARQLIARRDGYPHTHSTPTETSDS